MTVLTKLETWEKSRALTTTRRSSDLTLQEQQNVKVALRFLAKRFVTYRKLAEAMGAKRDTVMLAGHSGAVSAGIALRATRVAGVQVEAILSGVWPPTGMCPHCGPGCR